MRDVWFRKLGFGGNPFSIKPAAFSYELFGSDAGGLLSGVEEGKIFFVEAPLGYGKTTLLKSIVHQFGGKKKVIYAHALPSQKLDVKDLLKRSSLANFITGSLPSGMILVVDEAQNILPENTAEIAEFYKSGNLRAVVFFGIRYAKEVFASELGSFLNGNLLRLSSLTPEQAVSLVRGRIGNLSLLSNDAILSAYRKAKGSPRRLLQLCEDQCREAVESGRLYVSVPGVVSESGVAKPVRARKPRAAKLRAAPKELVVATSTVVKAARPAQSRPVKAKPARAAKPAAHAKDGPYRVASAKKSKPVPAVTDEVEGVYWGEFMGMQK